MARPESINDIKNNDRMTRIAMFEIERILSDAALLKHYTALLEVVQKMGGEAIKNYASVDFNIPKNKQQLEDQLKSDQYHWDEMQKFYNLAVNRSENSDEVPEWRRDSLKRWAEENDLPNPFDVFAANDPELAQIRADLNMGDE